MSEKWLVPPISIPKSIIDTASEIEQLKCNISSLGVSVDKIDLACSLASNKATVSTASTALVYPNVLRHVYNECAKGREIDDVLKEMLDT